MIPQAITITFATDLVGLVATVKSLRVLGAMSPMEARDMAIDNMGQTVTLNVVVKDLLDSEGGSLRLVNTALERFDGAVNDLRANGCVVVFEQ